MNTVALATAGIITLGAIALAVGQPHKNPDVITQIEQAEQAYYEEHGVYFQVIAGADKAHYQDKTVQEALGYKVPDGISVDVYETGNGEHGYQIRYEDERGQYIKGYRVQAEERTETKLKIASTTPV